MYTVINTILFLLFCALGLYYMFSDSMILKNPLLKNQKYVATGVQAFLIFTLATGMFQLGEWSAHRLFVWIVYCGMGIFIVNGITRFTFVTTCYILYIVYLFGSLVFLAPDFEYGIRVIAKYIYPLVVLLFVSKIENSEFVVLSAIKWMIIVALIAEASLLFWLPWRQVFWVMATMADHIVILVAVCLAMFFATKKKKYLLLMACLAVYPLLAVVRTGILGIVVCLATFSLIKYKWKAAPVMLGVILIGIFALLYVPAVRDKMFRKEMSAQEIIDNRDVWTMQDIDTNGRQAMWDWSLATFYEDNKVFGSGVGNLQMVFYSGNHPFGVIKIVHNDYIQILCDTGLVGLILFLLIGFSMLVHSIFIYNNKQNNQIIRLCAIVAGSSIVGVMMTSYTDNAVNYTFATYSYPFAFYGMALSLIQKYRR